MAPTVQMHRVTAEEEFKKNPDLKKEDLAQLRSWLATEKHLPAITDEMLILFHHSCYFDLARTKDCIECYYTFRTHSPEFFANRDITEPTLAKALAAMNFVELPKPLPNGWRIVFHRLKDFEPSKYNFIEGIKLVFMTFDSCFFRHGTMPGFVILFDMHGAKLGHLTRLNISSTRKFFRYIQEANPVRLKAIHVINVVPWMDKVMMIIKPFMKKELNELLHLHTGSDLEPFFKNCIPRECLPKDYGGDLESTEELNAEHCNTLESLRHYFAEEAKIRVDETKRDKKKKNKQSKHVEPELSFERLDID